MSISQKSQRQTTPTPSAYTYADVVAYLDSHWHTGDKTSTLERMKALNTELGNIAEKTPALLVAGTNGKSLTAHFTTKLLQEEGLNVGTLLSPHILAYNERITHNEKPIPNKTFTEIGSNVIAAAEKCNLECNSSDILVMMALLHYAKQEVDAAVLEVRQGGEYDPANICDAKVATVTRVTPRSVEEEDVSSLLYEMMGIVKPGTHIVSGDQNKTHLQTMQRITQEREAHWIMPIRKLAPLPYPFEQLHGRCAALAERMASVFVNTFVAKEALVVQDSLLVKQKGQRGRPTLEAKRQAELHPKRTIEQFWKETISTLPNRFQKLDKEKPPVLLDTADNIDAFANMLLGVRLLHYERPLKGLVIIVGAADAALHSQSFLKHIRYFFKKTPGQLFICPVQEPLPGAHEEQTWDPEHVANDFKIMKVKAQAFTSFREAFTQAQQEVDERDGLVVVSGSQSIVRSYWKHKGAKKLYI